MFARVTLIIGAIILFVASTTLGAAIRQPDLQRYDAIMGQYTKSIALPSLTRIADGTNMPLRRTGVEPPKAGAIWEDHTHQHTRGEEVDVPLPQPPAVPVEDAAVRRDQHPVAARVKDAIWRGNEHEEAKEKARHDASIDPANKRRTPEVVYRRQASKSGIGAIWKNNVHQETDKKRGGFIFPNLVQSMHLMVLKIKAAPQ